MDEPTRSLSPLRVERVLELTREINGQGVGIVVIKQNANLALRIAQRDHVLQTGRIVLEDRGSGLLVDARIRDAYLGGAEPA